MSNADVTSRQDLPTDEITVEEKFAILPEWLIKADIPDRAVRLYAMLLRYGNGTGRRMPGRRQLADDLHWSRDKVDDALDDLKQLGAVTVTGRWSDDRKLRLTNLYHVRTSDPLRDGRGTGGVGPQAHTPVGTQAPTPIGPQAPRVGAHKPQRPKGFTERTKPTPPQPPEVAAPPEEEGAEMTVFTNREDLLELAAELRTIRRGAELPTSRWTAQAMRLAVRKALAEGYDPTHVRSALRAVAGDRDSKLPGRLATPGPWWDAAEAADISDRRRARADAAEAAEEALRAARAACDCDRGWRSDETNDRVVRCTTCYPNAARHQETA